MKKYVNVGAANIYRSPSFLAELDSQAVLWEEVKVLEEQQDFVKIICEDGYEGWINNKQLADGNGADALSKKMVTQSYVPVTEHPDSSSQIIRDTGAGGYVVALDEKDGWWQILLPDGQKGWIQKKVCDSVPALTREHLINRARAFLGVPYYWAGKTPKGLDCSGFTQLVHKLFGINMRRDASMQFEDAAPVSDDPQQSRAGDLVFFAENGSEITHVGFCLGQGKILHARGMVRVNSLHKGAPDFDAQLLSDFVEIRSYIK